VSGSRFSARLFAVGLAAGAFFAAVLLAAGADAHPAPAPARALDVSLSGEPVVDWNRILLAIQATPGAQPATIQPTRNLAILQAAVYDAVAASDHRHAPYLIALRAPRGTSETASVDAAAHAALVALYPSFRTALDADYADALTRVPTGRARERGIRVGELVTRDLLAIRALDGSSATPPPFVPGTAPGAYRPTPPNAAPPVFTAWGRVEPFVLERGDAFRPAPPPALTSRAYAHALAEVQRLGSATSTARTAQQTEIGTFWNPPIQGFWNRVAGDVALRRHTDLATTARLFATLDLGIADATIALYDAKYAYRLWRPVTAIRLADADGNPATTADPAWLPLTTTTPPDPSYPGAHSTISAAAARILARFDGDRTRFTLTSPALPGVVRSFTSFSAAAREAGQSRIFAGVHTRLDHVAGQTLGRAVAGEVLRTALLPARAAGR
jgi:membrane-associated phospholipid phosphatase